MKLTPTPFNSDNKTAQEADLLNRVDFADSLFSIIEGGDISRNLL